MLKEDLTAMLGKDYVCVDEEMLKKYSSDQSFVEAGQPDVIVFVNSSSQIQEVVRYANDTSTPIIPFSSGLNLHGGTIPKKGGIMLDCSKINNILQIDENNWFAVIEPGVTLSQLQNELEKHHLRALLPWGAPPSRSALSSVIERDPALAAASFEYGNDLLMDTEIILPYGDILKTGLWSAGGKPGSHMGPVRSMLYRFWTAAQGTLGIITKVCIKVEYLPIFSKLYAFKFDSFFELMEPLKAIQRKEIGLESFILNHFNMAALLCDDWQIPTTFPAQKTESKYFATLSKEMPRWLLLIYLRGGPRLPKDKIAYEEKALQEIASSFELQQFQLKDRENFLLKECLRPWSILKKFCYRGSVHDLSFKAPLKEIPEFQKIISQVATGYGYPIEDIGAYILPIERGRAMHCEFDFHCDLNNTQEAARIKRLWLEASEKLIDAGAFFDRPYGAWADLMYRRTGMYTQKLVELKKELDPHNIMNPGHLCF